MKSLDDWKSAIVHFECGNWNTDPNKRLKGTGIFIKRERKFFLLTAAHVIANKNDDTNNQPILSHLYPIPSYNALKDGEIRKLLKKKFKRDEKGNLSVYLSDPKNELGEWKEIPDYLELSEPCSFDYWPIAIDKKRDIAVISLRPRLPRALGTTHHFPQELMLMGYQPIIEDDLASEPSEVGAEIYTIGYPSDIALIQERGNEISEGYEKWGSVDVSVPIYAFGKVAMLEDNLDYFWGDVRVYPGNSGSPIIENGKLVGIVTHQGIINQGESKKIDNQYLSVPFAKVAKAKFVIDLINEVISKDEKYVKLLTTRPEDSNNLP